MMKYLKILVLVLIVISCGEAPLAPNHYRINGVVNGLNSGDIYLTNFPDPADTIKVENGKFTIEKRIEHPVSTINLTTDLDIKHMDAKINGRFHVEPAIMTMSFDYNDVSKSKLVGSKTQDDFYRLEEQRRKITEKYSDVYNSYVKIRANLDKKFPTATEEEKEKLKDEEYYAKGKLQPMYDEMGQVSMDFIKNNPNSYISLSNLRFALRDLKYKEAKAIVSKFPKALMSTPLGLEISKELEDMQKGIPGAIAGNFDTIDINGNPLKLADFKGKYLLIDFWASWCIPCRKGSPHLIELFKKYNSKGLEVLGVASDDNNHPAWRKAVKDDNVGIWHHVLSGRQFDRKTMRTIVPAIGDGYNISTLPTKILIGPDGIIIGRYGSGGGNDDDMDRDLAALFEK